jgi:hypothetical protein
MEAANYTELQEKYSVSQPCLWKFRQDFAAEIEAVRNDLLSQVHDETSGLWIADKSKRIAEYQQDVDDINEMLGKCLDHVLIKHKHAALKAVAEELGALPTRTVSQGADEGYVHYTVRLPDELKANLT